MSTEPVPQRLSDADRDAAIELLRQHFALGRLDQGEFDDRLGRALSARFASDLAPLFGDLPDPHPDVLGPAASEVPSWQTWSPSAPPSAPVPWTAPPPPAPAPKDSRDKALDMAQALLWPVAILMMVFGPGGFYWIILAIIGSIIIKQLQGNRRTPPPSIGR